MKKTMFSIAAAILLSAQAWAGDYVNDGKKFSVTLPECWHLTDELPMEVFFSCTGNEDLGAAVEIIKDAKLGDKRVIDRIDLTNRAVTLDRHTASHKMPARRIDGNAFSEGDKLTFYSISIDPGSGQPILQLSIWGPPESMKNRNFRKNLERMLASFTPTK